MLDQRTFENPHKEMATGGPNSMTQVLLIEQDRNLCQWLAEHLIRAGIVVDFAHDGASGLRFALSRGHQVVVLGTTLRGLSGLQMTRHLRAHSGVGVLLLGNRGDSVDKIVALECGADDYLDKPFSPRELTARIRAISRRVKVQFSCELTMAPQCLEIGDLALDEGSRTVRRSGQVIELTSAEFDLLSVFLRFRGRVLHREELSRKILNREYSPFDRSIDVHVSNLRRKLGALPGGRERIRSVRNVGYIYAHSAGTLVSPTSFAHADSCANLSSTRAD